MGTIDLGIVVIVSKGIHDKAITYEKLNEVQEESTQNWYRAKKNVPEQIELDNEEYWELVRDNTNVGGDENVQSDWNQTDETADDYIKNKPLLSEKRLLQRKVVSSVPGVQHLTTAYAWCSNASEVAFTPQSANSTLFIRYSVYVADDGDGSPLAHFKFFVGGSEIEKYATTIYGQYLHMRLELPVIIPSWGVTEKVIGWQSREYSNGHNAKLHQLYYLDGTSSSLDVDATFVIEEWE